MWVCITLCGVFYSLEEEKIKITLQQGVALTAEAEYKAMTQGVWEIMWLNKIVQELH